MQSLALAEERFKAGAGSTLEVRDAQLKPDPGGADPAGEPGRCRNRPLLADAGHGHPEPGRVEMKWWKAVIAGVLFLGACGHHRGRA